jgi:hypothetical protein
VAGSYVITWTYDDGNGNSVTQTQNITIEDITAPVPDITDLPDIIEVCSATLVAPTATDDCRGTVDGTTDSLFIGVQGTYTVTWTYDDGSGNVSTQDQTVIISDTIAPEVICPDDVIACNALTESIALVEVSDNCANPVVSYELSGATTGSGTGDDASEETFNEGETVVTYTVDDTHGNTTQCAVTVTIETREDVVVNSADGVLSVEGDGTFQWINCADDSEIEGAVGSSFTPEETGEYAVIVDDGQCTVVSDCYFVEVVDFVKNNLSDNLLVYPNPVESQLTIELGSYNTNISLTVVNAGGQTVHRAEYKSEEELNLDMNDYYPGIYLIHLKSDQQNGILRIVKE